MLEDTIDGHIRVSAIIKGGAAQQSDIREGDVIESINGHRLGQGTSVQACTGLIRGPAGSHIEVRSISKSGAELVVSRIAECVA
jgi:C-terminal processing protease CtpA/Prc